MHDIQISNYPSIQKKSVSKISKYPDIRKKWYPSIPSYHAQLSNENQCYDEYPSTGFDVVTHFITDLRLRVHRTK